MKVEQYIIRNQEDLTAIQKSNYTMVLCFGSRDLLGDSNLVTGILDAFNGAQVVFSSTAGEIYGTEVHDDTIVISAIQFENTFVRTAEVNIDGYEGSSAAGRALVSKLDTVGLKYVLVLSDGSAVNGSELVQGINSGVPEDVIITGGLAGDGSRFEYTLTGLNNPPGKGNIIAIGLYGEYVRIGHGSLGGWDSFGLEKTVTKSVSNELFEINGESALTLYKEYLGKYAESLPSSALLFPLAVQINQNGDQVVRTILSIDDDKQSMVFAGDIPENSQIRLMKANFDRLIDAAAVAALNSIETTHQCEPKLVLMISCVGRKLILDHRIEEEVEAVQEAFGKDVALAGFYSYGEISPLKQGAECHLHNQTMTITSIGEITN